MFSRMMIKKKSNIAAAIQGRVYGNGSVGNDTTMAMYSPLNCAAKKLELLIAFLSSCYWKLRNQVHRL
jgi:hypothetical protein